MKVPKDQSPPGSVREEKDKTITRRTVKGAAGGMRGVDYEDDRRPEPGDGAATLAASSRARALLRDSKALETAIPLPPSDVDRTRQVIHTDLSQLVLESEAAAVEEQKRARRQKRHVARDRLAVDKDAPELVRQRRWEVDDEDDEAEEGERSEQAVLDFDGLADPALARSPSRARYFESEQRPEPGDPRLTDPDEIQRVLGSPLSYAKHAMILAEAFRKTTGATRDEAISYLAKLFVAPSDRSFGRLALKEFGPSSGILDIYPLEVIEHVLRDYPAFLPKASFGRLFHNLSDGTERVILTDTGTPLILEYPEELKIRGFAIAGGGRPGYTFEPHVEPGKYRLHLQTSGRYTVLVSALGRGGHTLIDRLTVKVRARTIKDLGLPLETSYYPERSAERVAAWPIPEPRPIEPEEDDAPGQASGPAGALSTGERVRLQQLDALKGPTRGETVGPGGARFSPPALGSAEALDADDDALLRLAVETVLGEAEQLATDSTAPSELTPAEDPEPSDDTEDLPPLEREGDDEEL